MSEIFNERIAFRMQLESLLKLRHELRSDYVDRDRVLSLEIKEIINKVQEIEQKLENSKSIRIEFDDVIQAEEAKGEEPKIEEPKIEEPETELEPVKVKVRKEHTRINYVELKERLQEILQESSTPLSLSSIVSVLEQKHGIHLSNPYVAIKKVTKDMSEVQETKEGRVLLFVWNK